MSSRLSPLQDAFLHAFFARTTGFRLTGGGALAGFHLGHRVTDDLDLFGAPPTSILDGDRAIRAAAEELGTTVEVKQDAPEFRRYLVARGAERTVVDLVIDRTPRLEPAVVVGDVAMDSEREIAANKVTTLLSRMEPRDLYDLRALLARGHSLEDAVAGARTKDGGADPATLAWVLSTYRIPATAPLPAGATAQELLAFRDDLVRRLTALAVPGESGRDP